MSGSRTRPAALKNADRRYPPRPKMRFHLGIRGRLLVLSLLLIATTVLVLDAYVSSMLRAAIEERLAADLDARAALVVADVERRAAKERAPTKPAGSQATDWQTFAEELSRRALARVTLIAADGRVIGDSEVSRERLPELDNHGSRPEVVDALRAGQGQAERPSATVAHGLLYVARATQQAEPVAVVRLSQSLSPIEASVSRSRELLLAGTMLALGVAALLSGLGAHIASRSLRELRKAAHRMVSDLSVRTKIRGADEVGALGEALDGLADSLSGSLKKLESERDRLEAILETMADGVLVIGSDGRIELASSSLRTMLGISESITGKLPSECIGDQALLDLLAQVAESRAPASIEIEALGLLSRRVRVRAAPLSGGKNEGGVVAVLSDVTELRRLETLRRDFVANVSHELRTPIAAIRAATETLEAGAIEQPEEAREFVGIVARHGERLHRLVEDLLDLSRIEAQRVDLRLVRIDLQELLDQIVELNRPSAERADVTLRVETEPLTVVADRRALEQILANLVDNAIKYAPGAEIVLTGKATDGGVSIGVHDTGPGIAPHHLARLFERFYRIDTGRSRALGGTGLGLSIAKHLTEAMRGRITVESEVGRGTVFTVWMPKG